MKKITLISFIAMLVSFFGGLLAYLYLTTHGHEEWGTFTLVTTTVLTTAATIVFALTYEFVRPIPPIAGAGGFGSTLTGR